MPDRASQLQLARALVEAVDTVSDDFDAGRHLGRVSQHCAELLDALAAGVMYADPDAADGGARLAVSRRGGELARELLEAQRRGGPCVEAYGSGRAVPPVRLGSGDALVRWPAFTARARARGVACTFAVPLRERDDVFGALNVFVPRADPAGARGGAGDGGVELARALAEAAAVGLRNHRTYASYRVLAQQLQSALTSRIRIEQAKGILAERWGSGLDGAFDTLRRYARRERLVMDAVAQAVIEGTLDDAVLRGDGARADGVARTDGVARASGDGTRPGRDGAGGPGAGVKRP
ncbi:ANTAR domain-containing protein [Streptomyces sp. G45]|uniref:GAF and ANTAR domain-containing protein n=1 Tax=Streptomyces sp. G45 TaxID=3406627 RepID=UPI003C294659